MNGKASVSKDLDAKHSKVSFFLFSGSIVNLLNLERLVEFYNFILCVYPNGNPV